MAVPLLANGLLADWDSWGKPLTDGVNQYLTGTGPFDPVFKRKTLDETVNNTATLQNDDELFVTVAANAVYRLWANFRYSTNTTADIKFGWVYPTGLTMRNTETLIATAGGAWVIFTVVETDLMAADGSGTVVKVDGLVLVGGTAGTLQLQWAQNVANASNTIVQAGSDITLLRVA